MIDLIMLTNPLAGTFKGAGAKIGSVMVKFLYGLGIVLILGVVSWFVYRGYKNKVTYTIPITLTILMENGMEKTRYDLKGGMFVNNGIKDFKVKAPKKYKAFILGYIPDLSKTNSIDGRLHFTTRGDQMLWQQVENNWILNKEVEFLDAEGKKQNYKYSLLSEPIPRETKQSALNSMRDWKETVDKQKITTFTIMIIGFIIMVIAHLISLFIQTKIKCG